MNWPWKKKDKVEVETGGMLPPLPPHDSCLKCGYKGLGPWGIVCPFPVEWCNGVNCEHHDGEALHRVCPKCKHLRIVPTKDAPPTVDSQAVRG